MVESTVATYIAVGFKVSQSNSIFYLRELDIIRFMSKLRELIVDKNPDFVSLRMVR